MPDTKKISVVVTGLVRNKELFSRSLDSLRGLAGVGDIVLSTWDTEAQENATILAEFQHKQGLKIIAVPEPDKWSGNLLSQMKSLYVGLNQVPADSYVLKTRTDVYIEPEALRHAFEKDLALTPAQNFSQVRHPFNEKVCVWGVEATSPFYIHDLFFFGRHADISKLVNMDIRYDLLYQMSKEKIHIRRFLHPFLHEFPIFEKFLHIEHVLGNTDKFPVEYRYAVLEKLLEDEAYILIMALYFRVVGTYFTNDWGKENVFTWSNIPDQIEFQPGMTLSDLLLGNRQYLALMLRGDSLFSAMNTLSFGICPVGERFVAALHQLDELDDLRDAGKHLDLSDFISRALSYGEEALALVRNTYGSEPSEHD